MTREIPLTRGFVALVDDEDFDWLSQWKWHYSTHKRIRTGYAVTGRGVMRMRMHHLILPRVPGLVVDHRNRNGVDNRRGNLRYATESENAANRVRSQASGFRGVYPCPGSPGRFVSIITHQGMRRTLGRFRDKVEAAHCYDAAATALFGEFAVLNFPTPQARAA